MKRTADAAPSPEHLAIWQAAEGAFEKDASTARSNYALLVPVPHFAIAAHLRLSLIAHRSGDYRQSVEHVLAANAVVTDDPDLSAMLCKRLFTVGEISAAIERASSPLFRSTASPRLVAEIGKLMTDAFRPELALELLVRARLLGLDSPGLSYLIGLSHMYCGNLNAAEHELEATIQADPGYSRAHWALSKLRRWDETTHHVGRIRQAIGKPPKNPADLPLLHYAAFKELDDLGRTTEAWEALSLGMRERRKQVTYDPAREQALFNYLLQMKGVDHAVSGPVDGPVPIFIVGMPRSGTTVVERMLGNHPDIADAGELHDLVLQLRWLCNRPGPPYLDLDLAQRAEKSELPLLGTRYLAHTRFRAGNRRFYTDKMPANYLNVGYIAKALPQARIIHVTRDPMDTCFSNLKELFAGAYPHSYDLLEMAGHFVNYRRLMAHWHEQFPGRILDVSYEQLVVTPNHVAERLLDFCQLDSAVDITAVHRRADAVTTASSVQVRENLHARYVGQWRRYEAQLAPLRDRLYSAP